MSFVLSITINQNLTIQIVKAFMFDHLGPNNKNLLNVDREITLYR